MRSSVEIRAGERFLGLCYGVLAGSVLGAIAGVAFGNESVESSWPWMLGGGALLAFAGLAWPRLFGTIRLFG
jgi:hypothetical protein